MKWFIALALALAAAAAPAWAAGPRPAVKGSKHDFSVTGPGPIRAVSETNECTFCHFPHSGSSNRPDLRAQHVPYTSSTMAARPGAPTGSSRACLSCHDGTIAVGETRTRKIQMTVQYIAADSPSNLGTDLRRTHPVSFRPAGSSGTHPPPPGDAVKLDAGGQVQCTSCHDPHRELNDPVLGKFLVKPAQRSALCLSCHDAVVVDVPGSSHAATTATFGPAEGNTAGFRSVAEAGCMACHPSHQGDPAKGRLVARPGGDDDALCLRCHSGTVSRSNIKAELSKAVVHSGLGRGTHDAAEGRPDRPALPETSPAAPRHVACVDCHDPHAAARRADAGGVARGPLAGVWGVDLRGQRVEQVRHEYELCFKCHGDSANKPQGTGLASSGTPVRAFPQANLREVFQPTSASFHPVAAPGKSARVPGLRAPYTPASTITCGDCHGSDNVKTGPRGPHGSFFPHLLERRYETQDRTVESAAAYDLCYKCHDRDTLVAPERRQTTLYPDPTAFRFHALHVGPTVNASCATCHDAHGVSAQAGSPSENAHLVSFEVGAVKPLGGIRRYQTAGLATGSCTLTCHDVPHDGSARASKAFPGTTVNIGKY